MKRRVLSALLSVMLIGCGLGFVFADTEHVVVQDDWLSKIAIKYNTTYQKLAEYNGIANPDLIYPGQVIKIPDGAAPAPSPAPTPKPEPAAEPENEATLILKNGVIYTIDDKDTVVTAVAAAGTEIIYVGDDAGAEAYIGESTKVIDLEGKMVTPGFINGHDHVADYQISERTVLLLDSVDATLDAYAQAIKDYAAQNPDRDVIIAERMDLQVYGDEIVNNKWLNEALQDRPVVVRDASWHGRLLNQKAMDELNITKDTPAPDGGEVYRYPDGNITGYFSDCFTLTEPLEDLAPALTDAQYIDAFKEFEELCASYGVTGMDDGAATVENWQNISDYSKTGSMTMRLTMPLLARDDFSVEFAKEAVATLDKYQYLNSDYLRIKQTKTFIDGVPEGKSALMLKPYAPTAEMAPDYKGPQMCTQQELNEYVAIFDAAGYQVLIHSMGDGACHMCTEAFDYALGKNGMRDARHTIVHATLMDPKDIKKAGGLGIYAATQPVWFYVEPQFGALEMQMWGEERFWREYVMRDMADAGMTITGGADYSITPDFRPLAGIECGVTQGSPYPGEQGDPAFVRNANQGLSVMDMLKVYTINGAKQAFLDDIAGSIEVGKKADFVVLAEDITKIDPIDISETEIVYTIFDGRIIYGD